MAGKTNPLPPGTVNLTTNMPEELKRELRSLAKASGMSLNKYCARVLEGAARKKIVYETIERSGIIELARDAEDSQKQQAPRHRQGGA
jgi:hypothetical protein